MAKVKRPRPIEIEDLLCIAVPGEPRLSPAGAAVAWTRSVCGTGANVLGEIWMSAVDPPEPRRLTSGPRDRMPRWSPDADALAFVRESERGRPQICLLSLRGGEAVALTDLPEGRLFAMEWSPDGRHVAFTWRRTRREMTTRAKARRTEREESDPPLVIDDPYWRLDGDGEFLGERVVLRVLEVATRRVRTLYDDERGGELEFDWSPESNELVIATNRSERAFLEPARTELRRVKLKSGRSKRITGLPRGPKTCPRWSPDGRSIAFAGRAGADASWSVENLGVFVVDLRSGEWRDLLESHDVCAAAVTLSDTMQTAWGAMLYWTRDARHVLFRAGVEGEGRLASVSLDDERLRWNVRGPFECVPGGMASGADRIAFTRSGHCELPEVWIADLPDDFEDGGTLRRMSAHNDELLAELDLPEPEELWIDAPDGTRVHTWMLRPPGAPAGRRTSAILEVHGGPHTQYGHAFFHEFHLLAAKGHTVFWSNPRGSKGYGRDFCAAIRGSWGQDDWTDVRAVIDHMSTHRGVDPARMGIMGGSYGGYMTNWAVAHTQVFRAAITDRCVSNLLSMIGSSDFIWLPDKYWRGTSWDRPTALWNASPIKWFKGVRTPMLIIHSEGDLRCNIEQAEQVHAALVVQKVPTRFVRYPRSTSHGMSRNGPPDMRVHRLREIDAWWRRWLLDDGDKTRPARPKSKSGVKRSGSTK